MSYRRKVKKILKDKPIKDFYNNQKSQDGYYRLEDIPDYLLMVIISLEDVKFFSHSGVDFKKIMQAFITDVKSWKKKMGGSSITQQLAKNMYFSFEKTFKRKIMEYIVARRIEKTLSKKQILELYLNIIYYGKNQYGIGAAAQYYYGCNPKNLHLNQCIVIGSLLPSPDNYNPIDRPDIHTKAKRNAIKQMINNKEMKETDGKILLEMGYKDNLVSLESLYEKALAAKYQNLLKKASK